MFLNSMVKVLAKRFFPKFLIFTLSFLFEQLKGMTPLPYVFMFKNMNDKCNPSR